MTRKTPKKRTVRAKRTASAAKKLQSALKARLDQHRLAAEFLRRQPRTAASMVESAPANPHPFARIEDL